MDEEIRESHLRVLRNLVGDIRAVAEEAEAIETEEDEAAFAAKHSAATLSARTLAGVLAVSEAMIDVLEDSGGSTTSA